MGHYMGLSLEGSELLLFMENDAHIHHRMMEAFVPNVRKKIEGGRYDASKAPRLWLYLVDEAAKRYAKEWPGSRFSKTDREAVANVVAKAEYNNIVQGEYGPPPVPRAAKRAGRASSPHKCPVGMHVQSILLPRSSFTPTSARSWLASHGYRTGLDVTERHIRARQLPPSSFRKGMFRTIPFGHGIQAVVGCPRHGASGSPTRTARRALRKTRGLLRTAARVARSFGRQLVKGKGR